MSEADYFDFNTTDEQRHDPGPESAWNESLAFCAVNADGSALFLRHGWRYNEGHTEATIAWINTDGSLDVCFRKEPVTDHAISDRNESAAAGLTMRLIEPKKQWRLTFSGTVKHVPDARAFAVDPRAALRSAAASEFSCDLTFRDTGPLFGSGPHGTVPGAGEFISSRHYESSVHCVGELSLDGVRKPIDTWGFRDHSWGVRDMTRAEFTRWIWAQVDSTTSVVGWFTGTNGKLFSNGIIIRNGNPEVARGVQLASSYEPGGDRYVRRATLSLASPSGDISLDIEVLSMLPLRYQKDDVLVRIIEMPCRQTTAGTAFPVWMEYIDAMVGGEPKGNSYR